MRAVSGNLLVRLTSGPDLRRVEEVVQGTWVAVLRGPDWFEEHLEICEGCVAHVDQMCETVRRTGC